jgi:hypothetical protein
MRVGVFTPNRPIDRLPRYLRLQFTPGTPGLETVIEPAQLEAAPIQNAIGIAPRSVTTRFAPVKSCIYCGATELRPGSGLALSEEHIVAEGLGGMLVLPEASCDDCARRTCSTETAILKNSLLAVRRRLKIKGKKRSRSDEKTYPATTIIGGKNVEIMLPLGDHPTVILMIGFNAPRMFSRDPKRPDISSIWNHFLGEVAGAQKAGATSVFTPSFDTVRFAQMIAKIAHGYAVYRFGVAGFRPLLQEFIRRKFARDEQYLECFDLVGGAPRLYAPHPSDLHTLGHDFGSIGEKRYLLVHVRLFANLGAPIYSAVVGEVPVMPT